MENKFVEKLRDEIKHWGQSSRPVDRINVNRKGFTYLANAAALSGMRTDNETSNVFDGIPVVIMPYQKADVELWHLLITLEIE